MGCMFSMLAVLWVHTRVIFTLRVGSVLTQITQGGMVLTGCP